MLHFLLILDSMPFLWLEQIKKRRHKWREMENISFYGDLSQKFLALVKRYSQPFSIKITLVHNQTNTDSTITIHGVLTNQFSLIHH
jgi:hypothetical protein